MLKKVLFSAMAVVFLIGVVVNAPAMCKPANMHELIVNNEMMAEEVLLVEQQERLMMPERSLLCMNEETFEAACAVNQEKATLTQTSLGARVEKAEDLAVVTMAVETKNKSSPTAAKTADTSCLLHC
jgi:hypothetical protein